jgi:LDH2 family malate/lactate/ureidoglycolate dehydrogenase
VGEFKATMDDIIGRLKNSAKAEGQDRIYIHGEKEFEVEDQRRKNGIPLHLKTVAMMQQIAQELGVEYDL